ncbi:hypothetical protein J2T60_002501 [Natronospira proteinivora]|uniref:Sporulation related protein n=1 Tax=Natronospira proteinivora TaxID=1807133 RepID=A0ABT1GAZ8_9GAMM|nr:hypothetical protein [Natronospira proteinivora]MCP1728501.1 hypothetical protein [Natronospira proteinivora]
MLRVLFILLLGVNLLLLLWQWHASAPDEERLIQVAQPSESVLRLAEDHVPALPAPGSSSDPAERGFELEGCLLLGGVESEIALRAVAQSLGIPDPDFHVERQRVQVAWWVIIPAEAVSEREQVAAELDASEAGEYFFIATGDEAGGVSLGLFSSEERALSRQQQLSDQGFETELRERWQEDVYYWLPLPLGMAFDREVLSPDQPLSIKPGLCPNADKVLVGRPAERLE